MHSGMVCKEWFACVWTRPHPHAMFGAIMKIILSNPRGFCAGVRMAIETVELAIQRSGSPLYVYHEIVHNKHVVANLQARSGVRERHR